MRGLHERNRKQTGVHHDAWLRVNLGFCLLFCVLDHACGCARPFRRPSPHTHIDAPTAHCHSTTKMLNLASFEMIFNIVRACSGGLSNDHACPHRPASAWQPSRALCFFQHRRQDSQIMAQLLGIARRRRRTEAEGSYRGQLAYLGDNRRSSTKLRNGGVSMYNTVYQMWRQFILYVCQYAST
jgi:hypothetical protein